jgi:hypothetical protein
LFIWIYCSSGFFEFLVPPIFLKFARNLTPAVPLINTKRPFTRASEESILAKSFWAGLFDERPMARGDCGRSHSSKQLAHPILLYRKIKMRNNSEHSFAIIRFNEKTYISGGVVAVVKGTESAQKTLNDYEWCQSQEDRSSGWRYFMEETDLQPGIDPSKATKLRQLRLDLQESQAAGF